MGVKVIVELIRRHKIVIFSKTTCPQSIVMKKLLEEIGEKYKTVEIDQMKEGPDIEEALGGMTGTYQFPKLFVRGKCVGDCSTVLEKHKKGDLKKLLSEKEPYEQ